ncbi:MAG: RsmE family RNA methyltransferase [Alphaproteobacteria bacterium]|nr:RsmE family RNA methyltransferase [Alphaproteobacteria bacterium]
MPRLFLESPLFETAEIPLDEKQFHYLVHVMRLKEGDVFEVFNGKEGLWQGEFHFTSKKKGAFVLQKQISEQTFEKGAWLYASIIKKDQMDWVVQKATELGVQKIIPLITEYTNAKTNVAHLRKIAIEASEQCERLDIPEIKEPLKLKEALACFPKDRILCYLSEREGGKECPCFPQKVGFFIGPEGGFSKEEFSLFKQKEGACSLHLGHRILRAETASVVALSLWNFSSK